MVGSAVCRRLTGVPCEVLTAGRDEVDLCDAGETGDFFTSHRPDTVIFAAAKVGGIVANNTYPVEFLSQNVLMALHCINAAFQSGVKRFLFLGSTCIYPRLAPQHLGHLPDLFQRGGRAGRVTGPSETRDRRSRPRIATARCSRSTRPDHPDSPDG